MQDKILSTLRRFWRGFLAFTPGQKVVTVAVGLALVVGGFTFSSWASKPDYAPLFTSTPTRRRTNWPPTAPRSWCRRRTSTTCG
jgi:flagellar biosynthesis/type III secretory pathway M-ring protein FliF/YscJ